MGVAVAYQRLYKFKDFPQEDAGQQEIISLSAGETHEPTFGVGGMGEFAEKMVGGTHCDAAKLRSYRTAGKWPVGCTGAHNSFSVLNMG